MINRPIDIHTHRPTEIGTELHTEGIHPWDAAERHTEELLPQISHIQAIGEIGLDFMRGAARDVQFRVLREQLTLAQQHHLPVVLHCVRAFEPLMEVLSDYQLPAVIFHGFIGSPEQARRATANGYYLSFGERTFTSPKTRNALRETPLDRIFCETDDSGIPIEDIYIRTAQVKGVTTQKLAEAIEHNYKRIFEDNDR